MTSWRAACASNPPDWTRASDSLADRLFVLADLAAGNACRGRRNKNRLHRSRFYHSAPGDHRANWLRLDPEVAARSYELGKRSWSDGGVSDAAIKVLVDQSMLELNSKDSVPLNRVHTWTFAEQARRELGNAGMRR